MAELDRLEAEIVAWAGHLAAAARWLALIAQFDRLEGYARWECQSCAHWLNWKCGLDMRSAREHVRVAHRLVELPVVRAAFEGGELSYSKVRAITRVAAPETEEDLVMLGRHSTAAQLERIVSAWRRVGEHADADQAQACHRRRRVSVYWDDDGSLVVTARLTPDVGAVLLAAFDQAEQLLPAPPALGATVRRADALEIIAGAYLDGVLDSARSAARSHERAQIMVHVDAEVLAGGGPEAEGERTGRCQIDGGPVLGAETARRLACDATWVRVVDGPEDQPLAVGRRTRTIGGALRRLLHVRDGGCRFPGCTNRRSTQAHHIQAHYIQAWIHGGRTDPDNLVSLCPFHHHRVHEGGWSIDTTHDGALAFVDPHGWTAAEHDALNGSAEHLRAVLTPDIADDAIACQWAGEALDLTHITESLAQRSPAEPAASPPSLIRQE